MKILFTFLVAIVQIEGSFSNTCKPGEYFSQDTGCIKCPKGMYCLGDGIARNCGYGHYSVVEGSVQCKLCPAGYSCLNKEHSPVKCRIGYYQNRPGRRVCLECPSGYFTDRDGSKYCKICPVGHYCPYKYKGPIKCIKGYYQEKRGQRSCNPCASGHYNNEFASSKCKVCPKGYYCPRNNEEPQICTSGYYQDKQGQRSCQPCPAGYYSARLGSVLCNICPGGHSCYSENQLPLQCREGYYARAGSKSCSTCPTNDYCPVESIAPLKMSNNSQLKAKIRDFISFSSDAYLENPVAVSALTDKTTGKSFGYVAYKSNKIVVAIRGSHDVMNWVLKDHFPMIDSGSCTGCRINAQFHSTYALLQTQILEKVNSLQRMHPNTRVAVTGHSTGGAIATLAAQDLTNAGIFVDLITFGSPRVGNKSFKKFIDNTIKGDNYRITYRDDITTVTPLRSHGYEHAGNEVHFTKVGTMYELPKGKDIPHDRFNLYVNGLDIYKSLL